MSDLSNSSMLDLFRLEVAEKITLLTDGLIALEDGADANDLEALMRAAHSVKGAARVVGFESIVQIAHVLEDCFVAAQANQISLDRPEQVDVLLGSVDQIAQMSQLDAAELEAWLQANKVTIQSQLALIEQITAGEELPIAVDAEEDYWELEDNPLGVDDTPELAMESPPEPIEGSPIEPATAEAPGMDDMAQAAETGNSGAADMAHADAAGSHGDGTNAPACTIRDPELMALVCREITSQCEVLVSLFGEGSKPTIEALIQNSYLIRGAAKIGNLTPIAHLAGSLQNSFLASQKNQQPLTPEQLRLMASMVQVMQQSIQEPILGVRAAVEAQAETIGQLSRELDALTPVSAPPPARSRTNRTKVAAAVAVESSPNADQPQSQSREDSGPDLGSQLGPAAAANTGSTNGATEQSPTGSKPAKLGNIAKVRDRATAPKGSPAAPSGDRDSRRQRSPSNADRIVRVSADNLNRLMGLAGESLVEANWLQPFADSLAKLRNQQRDLCTMLERLQESVSDQSLDESIRDDFKLTQQSANDCRQYLNDRINDLERFAQRSANLSDRLYREVIASHMRPFGDGTTNFPRLVRDVARKLGKQVQFEITGHNTPVDRDILEKLEVPLTHILQNAIDHGIESPEVRLAAGKPEKGTLKLEATHRAGMLAISITDDGRGMDLDRLRQKIVDRGMLRADAAVNLSEPELLDFLFLPGFSTAENVTQISGRGVGLDIVHSMVQEVGGLLRANTIPGKSMAFHLQLPLTLSVLRTLLVEVADEPYAFPLSRIDRIVMVDRSSLSVAENRHYVNLDDRNIGLITAREVLELSTATEPLDPLPVIIVSDRLNSYGLVVDQFLGERDLVVRPLDPRLGKIVDISSAALMEDGSPVLIIDVEDMVRSIDRRLSEGFLSRVDRTAATAQVTGKRVLVVDDSITVREVERKLLENAGYGVEVAVNGVDGWNAARASRFDLIISDVDMPRMNGFEMVSRIKNDPNLKSIPVIIISYKDREEDRLKGLEVGADYYLTKSSFHDDTLLNVVVDLIGHAGNS
jgi:two-component system, chemotaxis family, sensor histidine kinase and response regulator WspE